MQTLPLAQTSDIYTDACELVELGAVRIRYVVANASVYVELMPRNPHGSGEDTFLGEFLVTPEVNGYDDVMGIRFRSAIPGSPALVVAQSFLEGDPTPVGGVPFLSTLTSQGQIKPAGAVITGRVNSNGTIAAGSGFTVNRTGVGVYVVAFTPALADVPLILAALTIGAVSGGGVFTLDTITAAGFTITTHGNLDLPAPPNSDMSFNFTAQVPV
ncbi:MAG TPA: hypothetical protein VGJ25_09055 [Gaiellaceae bacterium]|jgi:hypothetical protein